MKIASGRVWPVRKADEEGYYFLLKLWNQPSEIKRYATYREAQKAHQATFVEEVLAIRFAEMDRRWLRYAAEWEQEKGMTTIKQIVDALWRVE